MSQLRQQKPRLDELGIRVMVVTFDGDFLAKAYAESTELPWPLLEDSEMQLYQAYGLARGGWRSILSLSSIWKYLLLIFKGNLPGRPGRDWRQLGGDVLIDPARIVRVHHVSEDPHDGPDVEELLQLVASHAAA